MYFTRFTNLTNYQLTKRLTKYTIISQAYRRQTQQNNRKTRWPLQANYPL